MDKIIETGRYVIRVLREAGFTDTVIAGGWVRDQLLNKEVKDVDIWSTTIIKKEELKRLFPDMDNFQCFSDGIDKRLCRVIKFTLDGVRVDIVTIDPEYVPEGTVISDTFDFNICKCWSDGENLHVGDGFWEDVKNQTLTYNETEYNNRNLYRIVEKHLPRLEKKFPGFEVVGLPRDYFDDDRESAGGGMVNLSLKADVAESRVKGKTSY